MCDNNVKDNIVIIGNTDFMTAINNKNDELIDKKTTIKNLDVRLIIIWVNMFF